MNSSLKSRPSPTLRIGIIGYGGRIRGLLVLLKRQRPRLEITAVYDPDSAAVISLQQDHAPGAHVCGDATELCAREDVDWVFIGSWNCYHAEQALEALHHGKHVFCEKPLALTIADARRMHQAAQQSGKIFALGLVLRYSPLYRRMKELLQNGTIGKLISFEFNETLEFNHGGYIHGDWRRKSEYAGSHLLEKCCHDLDLMLWLTGAKPKRVASFGGCTFFTPENRHLANNLGKHPVNQRKAYHGWPVGPDHVDPFTEDKDIVDHQVAILEFEDGLRATFHTNCNAGIPERRFYLLGTEGSIRADAMTGKVECQRIGWEEPMLTYTPTVPGSHAGGDEQMTSELVEVMLGRRAPAAGIAEGVRSLVLAHAIDSAMEEGRVVDISLKWQNLEFEFGQSFQESDQGSNKPN